MIVLAILALLLGCNDVAGPEGTARVRVLLTDAPSDYLASTWVCISQVYLQGGEEEDAGRTVLWEEETAAEDGGDGQCFDLLELQGVTADLTPEGVEVPAGTYHQLRLVVKSAHVTLMSGYTLSDGETTDMELSVPSGAQSGIKVQLLGPVVAEAGAWTEITVDADVNANFRIQGSAPDNILGVSFTPHLVEIEGV